MQNPDGTIKRHELDEQGRLKWTAAAPRLLPDFGVREMIQSEVRPLQFPIPDIRVPEGPKMADGRPFPIPPVLRQKLSTDGGLVTAEAWNDFLKKFPRLPAVDSFIDAYPISA